MDLIPILVVNGPRIAQHSETLRLLMAQQMGDSGTRLYKQLPALRHTRAGIVMEIIFIEFAQLLDVFEFVCDFLAVHSPQD